MVRGRTGHPLSYAEAKKMKSLTFHIIAANGLNEGTVLHLMLLCTLLCFLLCFLLLLYSLLLTAI